MAQTATELEIRIDSNYSSADQLLITDLIKLFFIKNHCENI